MARILIDGRFVGIPGGDSQTRYVLELVRNLLAIDYENEYSLLLRPIGVKQLKVFPGIEGAKNIKIEVLDIPHYSLAEQTKLLNFLNQQKYDLVHFTQFNHPVFYRGKYVTTIQDLTLYGHLHHENILKRIAFHKVMKSAAEDSKRIIAISKMTENDVVEYFKIPKSKIDLVYHGMDHDRFNMQAGSRQSSVDSFREKYGIKGEYILYTGAWKRHKNLKRMLLAYERFLIKSQNSNETMTKLVLVGKVDENEPEIIEEIKRINKNLDSRFKIQDSIVTTGFIEDSELSTAYTGAMMYCIPSLSEGFGWPPLEAMACGTAVISSKESCIPEILGDAPYYFDTYSIDDIAKAMEKVSTDEVLRADLIKKGLDQVRKYNWREAAEETLKVYNTVLKK